MSEAIDQAQALNEEVATCHLLLRLAKDDNPDHLTVLPSTAGLILDQSLENKAAWAEFAQNHNLALFVEADWLSALAIGADGVLLANSKDVAKARASLGDEAVIGVHVAKERHDAMLAGEAGADYVLVGTSDTAIDEPMIELVEWWCQMTVLPIAIEGLFNHEQLRALIKAGAGFMIIEPKKADDSVRKCLTDCLNSQS